MVLNNVTMFHKILLKSIRLRERKSLDRRTHVRMCERTGLTLNAPAIVMAGHDKRLRNLGRIQFIAKSSSLYT